MHWQHKAVCIGSLRPHEHLEGDSSDKRVVAVDRVLCKVVAQRRDVQLAASCLVLSGLKLLVYEALSY
jgi:hypothetical protein